MNALRNYLENAFFNCFYKFNENMKPINDLLK